MKRATNLTYISERETSQLMRLLWTEVRISRF